jgi:hypothetical protein
MKYVAGPAPEIINEGDVPVLLFGRAQDEKIASAGAAIAQEIRRRKFSIQQEAWDFLSIALAVVVADGATGRSNSPDGWTRYLELSVAVGNVPAWAHQIETLESALEFLTTDIWRISVTASGGTAPTNERPERPDVDGVALLSGGLDSLIGAIDLTGRGLSLLAVSHTVRGDSDKQVGFARRIGGGIEHLQLNHNASTPRSEKETSQRSRSMIFIAYAVLAATSTVKYASGEVVPIYLSENGFIAVNPPLTVARLGSLSTRTAHPAFLAQVQRILDGLGIRVRIINNYAEMTKGEMLAACTDQEVLATEAVISTSCGRFQRYNYRHCGRCVPCQIRRAAFLSWGRHDTTDYVFQELGKPLEDYALFDDVMSMSMAIKTVDEIGIDRWVGPALSSAEIENAPALKEMIRRGLNEVRALHESLGIR